MLQNRFERSVFDISKHKILSNKTILIAGAGGLGCGLLACLCNFSFKKIYILDCDKIEISNLNRQFLHNKIGEDKTKSLKDFMNSYDKNVDVETLDFYFDEKTVNKIPNVDMIFDCFDNISSKFLLNRVAIQKNIPLIHGGIDGFCGQVMGIIPHKTPCLSCFLDDLKSDKVRSYSPCVNLISSFMADLGIKILLGEEFSKNEILFFDIKNMIFKKMHIEKNPNCKICNK